MWMWASKLDHGATEGGESSLGKRWHQDALLEEDKPAGEVWCPWHCSARKPWFIHVNDSLTRISYLKLLQTIFFMNLWHVTLLFISVHTITTITINSINLGCTQNLLPQSQWALHEKLTLRKIILFFYSSQHKVGNATCFECLKHIWSQKIYIYKIIDFLTLYSGFCHENGAIYLKPELCLENRGEFSEFNNFLQNFFLPSCLLHTVNC